MDPVHVIGASGRSGRAVCRALATRGERYVPVVREAARWPEGGAVVADLTDGPALRRALSGARRVVSCAHARHAPAILDAAPADAAFVFLGSTRKFTRWPDAHGDGVRAGEAAFLASGRRGVMLHPTMIFGAEGEDNVRRLAALLRRLPVMPLPGGGRALVQPIFQDDVTRCVLAALSRDWEGPRALVIAGPEPLPYAAFAAAVAHAAGLPARPVLPVSGALLRAAAPVTALLPGLPRIRGDEVRRLLEDKAFDIAKMRAELAVEPMPLAVGLRSCFRTAPDRTPASPMAVDSRTS